MSSIVLCLPPSVVMLLMSFAGWAVKVPPALMSAMQHLAAGLVMCAVAVELCPILSAAPNDFPNTIGIVIGFFGGLAVFLLLGAFCEVEEEEEEEEEEESTYAAPAPTSVVDVLKNRLLQQTQPVKLETRSSSGKLRAAITKVRAANRLAKPSSFGRKQSKACIARRLSMMVAPAATPVPAVPFPFTFAVAVCVDAFVDGFLIGISQASGSAAGLVMSAALTIEMGFLGLTFAAAMSKQSRAAAFFAVLAPPAILIFGGVGGVLAADGLSHYPALHVGLISFGIAALLYLVTEELLLEAHHVLDEAGAENTWWITLMFFVGFLGAFMIEKVVDTYE